MNDSPNFPPASTESGFRPEDESGRGKIISKKMVLLAMVAILFSTLSVGSYFLLRKRMFAPERPGLMPERLGLRDNSFYLGSYEDCKAIFFTSDGARGSTDKNTEGKVVLFDCKDKRLESRTRSLDFNEVSGSKRFLDSSNPLEEYCSAAYYNNGRAVIYNRDARKVYFSIVSIDLEKSEQDPPRYIVNDVYELDLKTLRTKLLLSRVLNRDLDDYSWFIGCAFFTDLIDGKYLVLGISSAYKTESIRDFGRLVINANNNQIQTFEDEDVVDFINFKIDLSNKQISYQKKVLTGRHEECDLEAEGRYICPPITEISDVVIEDLKI